MLDLAKQSDVLIENFVPGKLVQTKNGPKFVSGQVIQTDDGEKFLPGVVMDSPDGKMFVPAMEIQTKTGPMLIPGQVKTCPLMRMNKLAMGVLLSTGHPNRQWAEVCARRHCVY